MHRAFRGYAMDVGYVGIFMAWHVMARTNAGTGPSSDLGNLHTVCRTGYGYKAICTPDYAELRGEDNET
ncbi:hypothetical protein BCON_0164g00100 [Botryotinia convoluta]|uniref:Uncharacterized protein n=1 Tax=Botryotinia convoluta TaxID=54673 RepID=A0A4Z1I3M2_9HELO|nr:hypothetical protein BCON_0164g00100 [Botryotinia convoluta]